METKIIEYADYFQHEQRLTAAYNSLQAWYKKKHLALVNRDLDLQMQLTKENDSIKCAELRKRIEDSGKLLGELNAGMRRCALNSITEKKSEKVTLAPGSEQRLMVTSQPGQVQDSGTTSTKEGQVKLSGIAAVYDKWTDISGYFREQIKQWAFREVLKSPDLDCRLLYNHSSDLMPLARSTNKSLRLYDTIVGLAFWGDLLDKDPMSDALVARIQRRDISGCSFAFTVDEDDWQLPSSPGQLPERTIIKVGELFDVGPVTYPAYPQTTIKVVREPRSSDTNRDYQEYFDECESQEYDQFLRQTAPITPEKQREIERGYRKAGRIINRCGDEIKLY